jgi:hypothetical protein
MLQHMGRWFFPNISVNLSWFGYMMSLVLFHLHLMGLIIRSTEYMFALDGASTSMIYLVQAWDSFAIYAW